WQSVFLGPLVSMDDDCKGAAGNNHSPRLTAPYGCSSKRTGEQRWEFLTTEWSSLPVPVGGWVQPMHGYLPAKAPACWSMISIATPRRRWWTRLSPPVGVP